MSDAKLTAVLLSSAVLLLLLSVCFLRLNAQTISHTNEVVFIYVTIKVGEHEPIQYHKMVNESLKNLTSPYINDTLSMDGMERMYNLSNVLLDFSTHLGSLEPQKIKMVADKKCRRCTVGAAILSDGFIKPHIPRNVTFNKKWSTTLTDQIIEEDLKRYGKFYWNCSRTDDILRKIDKAMRKHVQHGYDRMLKRLEKNFKGRLPAHQLWLLYESLMDLRNNNLTYPEFVHNSDIRRLHEISGKYLQSVFSTQAIRRLSGGVMVRDLIKEIKYMQRNGGTYPNRTATKMRIFVSTGPELSAIIGALSGPDGYESIEGDPINVAYPDYGAMHLLQVIRMKNGTFGIRVQYKNDNSTFFGREHILMIKGCDIVCGLPRLEELMSSIVLTQKELKVECTKINKTEKYLDGVHRIFPPRDPEEREIPRASIEIVMWKLIWP